MMTSIQPGGGLCMRLELAWGFARRWYLKTFRPKYVSRMAALRKGQVNACPFEVLDPRDVKFYRNQNGYSWDAADDPFTWRDHLPFARVGLAELLLLGGGWLLLALVLTLLAGAFPGAAGFLLWLLAAAAWFVAGCVIWFFRNPRRTPPTEPGIVVSPADGKVVEIREIANDEFLGGPAILVGIFLSVFNVHINRAPTGARVIGLAYTRGRFLSALRPESSRENEQLTLKLEENAAPHHRLLVRQIAGAVARRIVCWVKPADELAVGQQFGMIKLGSRTELVLPREAGYVLEVALGQHVKAGTSIIARRPAQADPA